MKIIYGNQIFQQQRYGGISRYFVELFRHISKTPGVEADIAIRSSINAYIKELTKFKKIPEIPSLNNFFPKVSIPCKSFLFRQYRRKWEQLHNNTTALENVIRSNKLDIFHPTYYEELANLGPCQCPIVLTVYDMIHEIFPDLMPKDGASERKHRAVDRADHIITISESTCHDLVRLWNIPEEKISVIHLGHSFPLSKPPLRQPLHTDRYILYVGERHYYKNFMTFAKAMVEIFREYTALSLAIVGKPFSDDESKQIAALGIQDRIRFLSNDDTLLPKYYSEAACFVFPSLYEGFGIPILEAMQCGCPMALSNTSSFQEIGGEAALYFNPTDITSIRQTIKTLLDDPEICNHLRACGRDRIHLFSWESTAQKTLEIYRALLSKSF